ncbi:class I SAM-dependent methyltransferase [Candidatus Woesearchaeota archaeon]|nr:class I SAM-dependent methyltransferase [Candidatus Woesearchaeota archaeon]
MDETKKDLMRSKKMNQKKERITRQNRWFFDSWAEHYDFLPFQFWMKKFHLPVLEELTSLPKQNKKIKILDLSCGSGELLREIEKIKMRNVELYGIDVSSKMIDVAKKKLSPAIRLKMMDVHHLDFPKNCFDYVISTEAFHHYHNQRKALFEMGRVCKKSGRVIVVDINFFSNAIHRMFEIFEPGCVRVNSQKEMFKLFQKAGLQKIEQQRGFLFSVATSGIK